MHTHTRRFDLGAEARFSAVSLAQDQAFGDIAPSQPLSWVVTLLCHVPHHVLHLSWAVSVLCHVSHKLFSLSWVVSVLCHNPHDVSSLFTHPCLMS